MSPQRRRTVKAWGGFCDGKLYVMEKRFRPTEPVYDEPRYAIFPTRGAARRAYQDVRRIEIRELPKQKPKRKT